MDLPGRGRSTRLLLLVRRNVALDTFFGLLGQGPDSCFFRVPPEREVYSRKNDQHREDDGHRPENRVRNGGTKNDSKESDADQDGHAQRKEEPCGVIKHVHPP